MPKKNIVKGVLAYMEKRLAESNKPPLSDLTYYLDRDQGRQRFYDRYFELVNPQLDLVDQLIGDEIRYFRFVQEKPETSSAATSQAALEWVTKWLVATSILINPVEQWAYDSLYFDNSLLGKGYKLIHKIGRRG